VKRLLVALLAVSMFAFAACGDDESGGATAAGADNAAAETTAAPAEAAEPAEEYSGRDADLPNEYPEPEIKEGTTFKVGYLQIYAAVNVLRAEQEGAAAAVKELGGEMIVKDAGLNLQKQVAQFEELLAENVDAIVVYPVVPETLVPSLKKAKAKGIPVISTNARPDVEKPLVPGYTSDVEQAIDFEAWSLAQAMSKSKPGGKFAVIGLAIPVQALRFLSERTQVYAEEAGMEFIGRVDVKEDTPAGYGAAMTALLAKYPDVEAVFTYSDILALAAEPVARSSNKKDILIAGAAGGTRAMHEAIKAGRIHMTYQIPWRETGAQMIRGAYLAVTKQQLPLPETITLKGQIVTKDNVGDLEPVD
jgi:ABC-type sugar transport system substrate-binding protein